MTKLHGHLWVTVGGIRLCCLVAAPTVWQIIYARVKIMGGAIKYVVRIRLLHRAYPSLHPSGVVHWVPEQLNMKAVTWEGVQIDWWLQPRAAFARISVASSGKYVTEMESIQLHDSIVMASPWDSRVAVSLHSHWRSPERNYRQVVLWHWRIH